MTFQQINLYQPLFRKQQKIFSAGAMLEALAVIVVGLLLFFAYARWQSHQIAVQFAQLETRRADTLKRLEQLRVQFPERPKDPELEAQVIRLRSELQNRQQIVARLDAADAGNVQGFADHLEGLARQKPASLWLTDVELRQGGKELVLRGSTLQPEQVPRYLERLTQEAAFTGREFRELEIVQPEKERGHYDFLVSTGLLSDKEKEKRP